MHQQGTFGGALDTMKSMLGKGEGTAAGDEDLDRWDAEDLDVRELLERLQRHHDCVSREFLGQRDLVTKLHNALEKETDELKRLLSSAALEQAAQKSGVALPRQQALLTRVKGEIASRRIYEANEAGIEAKVLLTLRRLQQLLDEGAQTIAKRVVSQIARDSDDKKEPQKSELLHEILTDLQGLHDQIIGGVQSIDTEARRQTNTAAVWEAAIRTESTDLATEIARQLKAVRTSDVEADGAIRTLLSTLKSFVERVPAFTSALEEGEGLTIRNLEHIVETHNPALEEQERRSAVQRFQILFEQLADALMLLMGRVMTDKAKLDELRERAEELREALNKEVDDNLAVISTLPSAETKPTYDANDIMSTLQKLFSSGDLLRGGFLADQAADAALRMTMLDADIPLEKRQELENKMLQERLQQDADQEVKKLTNMLDQEVLASKIEEEEKLNARMDEVHQALTEKPITEVEKEHILTSLEQDKKALDDALEAERLKQEEQIKNVLQAKQQKKLEEQSQRHNDELEEEEMLRKHEEEMRRLETELENKRKAELQAIEAQLKAEAEKELASEDIHSEATKDNSALQEVLKKATSALDALALAKLRHERMQLRDEQNHRRAMKAEELDLNGASSEERDAALRQLERTEAEEVKALEERFKKQMDALHEKEQKRQAELLANGAEAQAELRRLHNILDKGNEEIAADLQRDQKRQKELLAQRLERKRRLLEAKLKRENASPEETRKALAELERQSKLEDAAIDDELAAEKDDLLAQIKDIKQSTIQPEDAAAEVAMLRQIHDRGLAALQAKLDEKRRAAERRLKYERQQRKDALEANLKLKGVSEAEQAKVLQEFDRSRDQEEEKLEQMFNAEREALVQTERDRQTSQLADGAPVIVEMARLKDQLEKDYADLLGLLVQDKQRWKAALLDNLKERRKLREKQVKEESNSDAETQEALKLLDAEQKTQLKELEAMLEGLSSGAMLAEKRRQALAEGKRLDEEELLGLKAQHEKELGSLSACLDAEKELSKAKLRKRIEERRKARATELEEQHASPGQIQDMMQALDELDRQEEADLENRFKNEASRQLEEKKKAQLAALAELKAYEAELQEIQSKHDAEIKALQQSQAATYQRNKAALQQRLAERRQAKERAANQLDEIEKQRELEAIKFEETRELSDFEAEMQRKQQEEVIEARHRQVRDIFTH